MATDNALRTRLISFSASQEELALMQMNADRHGLPLSDYLRRTCTGSSLQAGFVYVPLPPPIDNPAIGLLKNFRLFASLSDQEIHTIIDRLGVRTFKKNEVILFQEDANNFMYVVLDGKAKITRINEEGKEIILALRQSGDFFGEMSLIDGNATSATVRATENSIIAVIPKNDFYTLLYSQEKILLSLLQIFCQRIRTSNNTIEIMSHTSARQRVLMMLATLARTNGEKADNGDAGLDTQITHLDIADMTGLTRETVTKVMSELKKDGAVSMEAGKYVLSDDILLFSLERP